MVRERASQSVALAKQTLGKVLQLLLPVDETVPGAGIGPALPGVAGDKYTQNRATIHLAPSDNAHLDVPRVMHRVMLTGDVPVGVDGTPSRPITGTAPLASLRAEPPRTSASTVCPRSRSSGMSREPM